MGYGDSNARIAQNSILVGLYSTCIYTWECTGFTGTSPPFSKKRDVKSKTFRFCRERERKMHTTQLRMCSLGAKEVAAVYSCFVLVRTRQHCIARNVNVTNKLISSAWSLSAAVRANRTLYCK